MKYLPKIRNAIQIDSDWAPVEHLMNYEWIDGFVKTHIEALIKTYGFDRVEEVVENEIPEMESIAIIGYIIEIGGTLSLSKIPGWVNLTSIQKNNLIEITVVVMDAAIAYHMMLASVYFSKTDNYFGKETLRLLIDRVSTHTSTGEAGGEFDSLEDYAGTVYMQYLLPINGLSSFSWI